MTIRDHSGFPLLDAESGAERFLRELFEVNHRYVEEYALCCA